MILLHSLIWMPSVRNSDQLIPGPCAQRAVSHPPTCASFYPSAAQCLEIKLTHPSGRESSQNSYGVHFGVKETPVTTAFSLSCRHGAHHNVGWDTELQRYNCCWKTPTWSEVAHAHAVTCCLHICVHLLVQRLKKICSQSQQKMRHICASLWLVGPHQ